MQERRAVVGNSAKCLISSLCFRQRLQSWKAGKQRIRSAEVFLSVNRDCKNNLFVSDFLEL